MSDEIYLDENMLEEFLEDFISETGYKLKHIKKLVVYISSDPQRDSIVDEVFRLLHTLKGNSALFGFMRMKTMIHAMEDVMDDVRKKEIPLTPQITADLFDCIDCLEEMADSVRQERKEKIDDAQYGNCLKGIESHVKRKK